MYTITEIIEKFPKIKRFTPASAEEIELAEQELGIRFARDYEEYLSKYGAIISSGLEITGLRKAKFANVVSATKEEWKLNPSIPHTMYLIQNIGIDGILIWQDSMGNIYESSPKTGLKQVYSSLSEYISTFIK